MPIDYKKYPPNWRSEIVPRILKRADNCCEICGVMNHEFIHRKITNNAIFVYQTFGKKTPKGYKRAVKIILTVHHLDHDPENHDVKDGRLKALCQRCHHIFNNLKPIRKE